MSEDKKPKQILEARAERKRGRPRIEWENYMGQIMGRKGKCLQEIRRMIKDKDKFRRWLHISQSKEQNGTGILEEKEECQGYHDAMQFLSVFVVMYLKTALLFKTEK